MPWNFDLGDGGYPVTYNVDSTQYSPGNYAPGQTANDPASLAASKFPWDVAIQTAGGLIGSLFGGGQQAADPNAVLAYQMQQAEVEKARQQKTLVISLALIAAVVVGSIVYFKK